MTEILLKKSEDESSDVCAGVRVAGRSRDETQNNDAGVETQDAGGNEKHDILSVGTMFEERSERERGERTEDLQARLARNTDKDQGSRAH